MTDPAKRLRVLIDGYYVDSKRGMGRYIREVIDALGAFAETLALHVVVPTGAAFRARPEAITYHEARPLPFPAWEQFTTPSITRRLQPDIVHSPYNTFPLSHRRRRGQVVTVHDLFFLDPDFRTMGLNQEIGRWYRRLVVRTVPGSAVQITTMTQTVAAQIRDVLHIDPPIHRTPIALFIGGERDPAAGLTDPFVLHVGGAAHHKNTPATVRAFRAAQVDGFKLVVVGIAQDHPLAAEFAGPDVIFSGWITDGQLLDIYDRAAVLVFPSLSEGYGLPVLEGMARGCAVITSDRAPMTELAADAALIVDPTDEIALAQAIRSVCLDETRRADLVASGLVRAEDFSPARTAAALEDIYWKVAKGAKA